MERDEFQFRESVPVKVGDELEVKIEAVGAKGDGIAKKEGFVLFVPGVQEGDNVRIKVTRVLRKVGFAEVVGSSSGEDGEAPQEEEEPAVEEAPQEEEKKEDPVDEQPPQDSENFGEEEKQ